MVRDEDVPGLGGEEVLGLVEAIEEGGELFDGQIGVNVDPDGEGVKALRGLGVVLLDEGQVLLPGGPSSGLLIKDTTCCKSRQWWLHRGRMFVCEAVDPGLILGENKNLMTKNFCFSSEGVECSRTRVRFLVNTKILPHRYLLQLQIVPFHSLSATLYLVRILLISGY